jgi:hypothetical protein
METNISLYFNIYQSSLLSTFIKDLWYTGDFRFQWCMSPKNEVLNIKKHSHIFQF